MRVAFGERFDIRPGYLNTASIGVPSVNAADTLAETVTHWRTGSAQPADFDADVATGAGVSQLIGLVAACVPDGTRV